MPLYSSEGATVKEWRGSEKGERTIEKDGFPSIKGLIEEVEDVIEDLSANLGTLSTCAEQLTLLRSQLQLALSMTVPCPSTSTSASPLVNSLASSISTGSMQLS